MRLFRCESEIALLVVVIENRRHVLTRRARRAVVIRPEDVQERAVRRTRRIELDLHRFGVISPKKRVVYGRNSIRFRVLQARVGRIEFFSARVADFSVKNSLHAAELRFGKPKSAHCERSELRLVTQLFDRHNSGTMRYLLRRDSSELRSHEQ